MKNNRYFWKCVAAQSCLIFAYLFWRFYTGVKVYLAHPTDGDLYAHNWSFQLIVFCIFRLLPVLVGMIILFTSEWFTLRFMLKAKTKNEKIDSK
jgi:hypothetical protein